MIRAAPRENVKAETPNATVLDREELGDAALGLVLEHLDRVSPAGRRLPLAVTRLEKPSRARPCRRLRARALTEGRGSRRVGFGRR